MRAILNAMGATLWGAIAISLAAAVAMLAYRASLSWRAGDAPKENLYLFKLQCASNAGDTKAMVQVLADLIRLTNKTTYWNTLLRIERQDERDDHNTLMIYRIMFNTNSMNTDTDYIETALNRGTIKDEHKDRADRLLTALRVRT
jgi:hypothetical protein